MTGKARDFVGLSLFHAHSLTHSRTQSLTDSRADITDVIILCVVQMTHFPGDYFENMGYIIMSYDEVNS